MSMSLYDILEVSKIASPEAISESYKRLYANYSGDSAQGNEDATNRLIALREAYNTLANPEKRKAYDQKLAAAEFVDEDSRPQFSFLKLLLIASILGTCGVAYSKYKASEEQARLQIEEKAAAVRLAELEARKAKEEKLAAEQAEYQRRRDEAYERANREREYNYGKQVSRDIQKGEMLARWEKEKEARQQENEERQKQYDAERQLAKEKAYLRKIEAENARYPRY